MKVSLFDYSLPEELVAHEPLSNRHDSRLLYLHRDTGKIQHHSFRSILELIPKNALLVFNNTEVINARLYAKSTTDGQMECFLVEQVNETDWLVMAKPSKRLRESEMYRITDTFTFTVLEKFSKDMLHLVRFSWDSSISFWDMCNSYGHTPLPPYIKSDNPNIWKNRYQTVFASQPGAVAAPTAGLHFDDHLLKDISNSSIETCEITLHVGLGTFNPIKSDSINDHDMHYEEYAITESSAQSLNIALEEGRPIIAVGTTVCRCLESNIRYGHFKKCSSEKTNLFISPGYEFKAISGLITNFHLPKSSLMVLVSSFTSIDTIQSAYQEAIAKSYRFFSFGDAMLIL